ncbi:reverse transcriptase domain-containing protein [Tanacetum coccineum]
MLKFLVDGGIVTIRSTILIPAECVTVITSSKEIPKEAGVRHENLKKDIRLFDRRKGARPWSVRKPSKQRIVTPFQKSTRKLNLFAATPLSVSWTLTKAITRYIWQSQMKRKRLSTPAMGQVGQNIEVYVDDLVIKSHTEAEMLRDIDETFYAEQAFKQLKQHLSELPLLVAPKPKEELIVYLSASHGAISAVLMTERGTVKTPVYFILADFLLEKPDESPPDTSVVETPQEPWTLFTYRSSCIDGFSAGLILTNPEGTEFTYALRFQFTAFNNEAYFAHLSKQVLVEIRKEKSIQEKEVTTVVEEDGLTWMTPIIEYLKEGTLPEDKKEASKLPGPFPKGPGKVKFLIVAMDYFTKWIEAKPVSTITGNQVKKFVWDNIVCRFGLPGEIVSDNGKQFSDNPFKDWCEKLNITQRFASMKHPQSNGLVERANRILGDGIKARLGEGNKTWIEELPYVL